MTATIDRARAQRLSALERANDIRIRRAALKRDIKTGRVDPVDIIAEPPSWARGLQVYELLSQIPRWGRVKVNRRLAAANVPPGRTLGQMTVSQRIAVIANLEARR